MQSYACAIHGPKNFGQFLIPGQSVAPKPRMCWLHTAPNCRLRATTAEAGEPQRPSSSQRQPLPWHMWVSLPPLRLPAARGLPAVPEGVSEQCAGLQVYH